MNFTGFCVSIIKKATLGLLFCMLFALFPLYDFNPLKIFNQDICAVLYPELGGVQYHVIVVHIPPDPSGMSVLVLAAGPVGLLQHGFRLFVGQGFQTHDAPNPILLVGTDINIEHIPLIPQDFRGAAP